MKSWTIEELKYLETQWLLYCVGQDNRHEDKLSFVYWLEQDEKAEQPYQANTVSGTPTDGGSKESTFVPSTTGKTVSEETAEKSKRAHLISGQDSGAKPLQVGERCKDSEQKYVGTIAGMDVYTDPKVKEGTIRVEQEESKHPIGGHDSTPYTRNINENGHMEQKECTHPNTCMYEPTLHRAYCPDCGQIVTTSSPPETGEGVRHVGFQGFKKPEEREYIYIEKINELVDTINHLQAEVKALKEAHDR